jgi:DNA repair exonuclease SbcCD ATPase subunit/predicted MPP superfamily phosphohydrolase
MLKETLWSFAISEVEKILHISDIHIRNLKRHEEYRSVFKKLYDVCRSKVAENKNTIIYLAGDIVHAKTDMTPELVEMVTEFLDTISRIAPTILIAGNHDCNLNNMSRMDALSPIVSLLTDEKNQLFYLKHSGVYYLQNVDFVLNSVYENPKDFILAKDIEGNRTKIVLYHGPVDRASTDTGVLMKHNDVKIEMFDGFDYGMFGDIHKFQYLDVDGKFAYAGSLIQQNYGEGLVHGIIEWDIKNKKSKFIEIENDWSYHTIDVENGKIKKLPTKWTKYNSIRLRITNTPHSEVNQIMTELKSLTNVIDIRTQHLVGSSNGNVQTKVNPIGKIRDVEYQNKLITDYVNDKFTVTDDILEKIRGINRNVNTKLSESDVVRNLVWKPISFEFENMFSYGKGNRIQLDGMNGVYGLFAPNASGKSSVLDAIMFCLFDKCSRTFKAAQVLNNKKDNFQCKLHFMIGEKNFYIKRVATKEKKGNVKVNVDFWYEENGDLVSLNGEDRDGTNYAIRKYIGTYDDFVLTAMSLQGNNTNFVDKAQKDRKDLLAQFFDLNLFEELNSIATDEVKGLQALVKEFKKQDHSTKLANAIGIHKANTILLEETTDQKDYIEKKIEKLTVSISELNKKLIPIGDNFSSKSVQSLLDKRYLLDRKGNDLINEIKSLEDELGDAKTSHEKYIGLSKEFDKETLMEKKERIDIVRNRITELEADLRSVKLKVQHCQDKIDNLKDHEYDPNCEFCVNNVFVKDAERAKSQIWGFEQDRDELNFELSDLNEEFTKNSFVYSELEKLHSLENSAFKYEKQIYSVEKQIFSAKEEQKKIQDEIGNIDIQIEKYKENEDAINQNNKIQSEIDELENEKNSISKVELKRIDENILEYNGNVKVSEKVIDECEVSIQKLKDLEKEYEAYDYYLKAVNRNGVPYELISNALPSIQEETNNILANVVDFQVLFDTDGKSINTYIVYDDDRFWNLELSSGMEKFISSLAIRTALIQVSSLPRPNFIAIDEGLGVLDPTVMANFSLFMEYLKTQFEFVILISHIDSVRDMVDNHIEIKKENGFSKIET